MDEMYNKHYIKVDSYGRIVDGFSDAFRQPTEDAICINEQGGYQFRLSPNGEENPCLWDWDGMISLYKYEGGEIVKRTEEEIEADRAAIMHRDPAAPHNIVAGEYVTIDGVLYLATENIPNGEPVIAGQNATITTIEEQLREMKGD